MLDTGFVSLQYAPFFALGDIIRSAQGSALGAFGLDPVECAYRVVASGAFWQLRDYGPEHAASASLIVAAPIKRPYIWDLAASVSPIRYCCGRGQRMFLLEWLPATENSAHNGLTEYTDAIVVCAAQISRQIGTPPLVLGHSLGGTLAALSAARAPEPMRGLVLLSSPLCFAPGTSRFGDALVRLVPSSLSEAEPCPGSLLSHVSALAAPEIFVWSRLMDAILSASDRHALDIHARVERWALDEVPLSGKLVREIVDWLYREDRFCRGTLQIGDAPVKPSDVRVPALAVVNTRDDIAPLAAIEPFVAALPEANGRIIDYPGEVGVGLQHLGVLVGREALARLWPQIVAFAFETLTSQPAARNLPHAPNAAVA
ncbi:MAG TPA: alpha/beta fold hydrolase [Xanthobacteraceae bacterium]|nr:alpha/beta fold hydrolase [Xanthobacteraceae bacterium]